MSRCVNGFAIGHNARLLDIDGQMKRISEGMDGKLLQRQDLLQGAGTLGDMYLL